MINTEWAERTQECAITVCDTDGVILYMNELSRKTFCKDGVSLIGRNLKEFHSERSWDIITKLLTQRVTNEYTVEKNGVKKLIKQSPWYDDNGEVGGLVELSIVIRSEMAHHVR